jgi:hypothetical protein
MKMWSLGETAIKDLAGLPETGMGFQLVEAVIWGTPTPLLVLNSDRATDLSEVGLLPGDDPAVILRNGLRVIEALKGDVVTTMIAAPAPHSFRLLNTRIGSLPATTAAPIAGAGVRAALPSSLVKHDTLGANRTFHRFSAFNPDRRVDPVTGSFLAGTYAAPESEVPFVPTGFVAVGRFALPNTLPASFHYEIEAPTGTSVDFGTVAPAFGQAGGGVEAYFANAVTNAKVPHAPIVRLPDE